VQVWRKRVPRQTAWADRDRMSVHMEIDLADWR